MSKNLIILQHISIETPGYILDLMIKDGMKLTTIELDEGEKIPENLNEFDGMFCMGGPMDTWMEESYPWLIDEKEKIKYFVMDLKKPFLGFCLGKKKKFESNIEMVGTSLQKKIWKELLKIPYGSTKSYGEIAKKIKTSPRYVGNVCGQNKHLLIVPCHRVVKSDRSLGGFSSIGGIKLKKRLLKHEHHE